MREKWFATKFNFYIHKYFKVGFDKYKKNYLDLGWVSVEWLKLYLD